MKLKSRLIVTYALFTSLALLALAVCVNVFVGKMFEKFVRSAIEARSAEIVRAVSELYNPMSRSFDIPRLEAIGMLFVHEGYVIDVESEMDGVWNKVWDAREMDMRHCVEALREIEARMESRYGLRGELQSRSYPIPQGTADAGMVGAVNIATYGPFFYSENESDFLSLLNSLLVAFTAVCIVMVAGLSVPLAVSIARPVARAGEAAGQIAGGNLAVRLDEADKIYELAGLARSINGLAGALEEAGRRQKQLTADIAHELRTPLTCLRGGIEAMVDGVWEPDPARLQSCAEEVRRLSTLVDDLALLSRIEWETLALNKTRFEIAPFLRLIADGFVPAAAAKNIAVECRAPFPKNAVITADYDRLKQVLINLLSNAVKYTDKGTITLSARPLLPGGAFSWEIAVSDTGIGIGDEDMPRVFDRFYRSDKSRSRETGGYGLGLAIAAAIVKAHGGGISVESDPYGTVFRVFME
jgi:signal transduction histidine kinase